MIVWLNGAFGVGKTAVARELLPLLAGSRLVDPERLGFVMRRTFWSASDYQDVALWRRLVRAQVTRAGHRGTAVVPMTVVDREVLDEIASGARVFLLTAKPQELRRRIERSDEAEEWRLSNLSRCLNAFDHQDLGEPVQTDARTPSEVAKVILERITQKP